MKATMKAARCSFHFRPFHVSSVLSLCMLIEDAYRATEINWNVMISTEMKWTPCAPAFMSSHFCRSVRRVRILNILKFFYWVFFICTSHKRTCKFDETQRRRLKQKTHERKLTQKRCQKHADWNLPLPWQHPETYSPIRIDNSIFLNHYEDAQQNRRSHESCFYLQYTTKTNEKQMPQPRPLTADRSSW